MGSSANSDPPPGAAFAAAFRERAGPGGTLRFDEFGALALYDPAVGYYRRERPRVGRGPGTDFFTAASVGTLFGELVAAACHDLLAGRPAADFTFVEIGAEGAGGILEGVEHGFGAARTVRLGEPLALEGPCVVFANELFDAQPFRRWRFRAGAWRELGVRLDDAGLAEIELGPAAHAALPASAPEGYLLDAPLAAADLAAAIAAQPWSGLLATCDYGKSWPVLCEATPGGTARAYFRHRQSNALLAHPGEQDLTCHVCWDWIAAEFTRRGFAAAPVCSQEAFFVRHAGGRLAELAAAEAGRFSARKLALAQLLHPAHLGQKFQVFVASRWAPGSG
jgi:SAM-dependent MidA family methyltransferase